LDEELDMEALLALMFARCRERRPTHRLQRLGVEEEGDDEVGAEEEGLPTASPPNRSDLTSNVGRLWA
jgi:hypothetical protein